MNYIQKLALIFTIQVFFSSLLQVNSNKFTDTLSKIPHTISNAITDTIHSISKIPEKISDTVSDAFSSLGEIPEELPNKFNEITATSAVYLRNNVSLNCLGLSIKVFANAIEKILTDTTKAQDVRFYFATRNSADYATVTLGQNFTLKGTDFDIERNTVVIVHGFMSRGTEDWVMKMKDALLQYDDVNVIMVDWQRGSNTWNYLAAAVSTKIVGQQIAKLFAQIRQVAFDANFRDVSDWGDIHLIGHSLGAHICARAAYGIKQSQKKRKQAWIVDRITGLDPAQPCFTTADKTLKLDRHDALYVDVIHTNARHILYLGLGLPERLGFVDFYPNGGQVQPGCSEADTSYWKFLLLPKKMIETSICSHGRSHSFLIESILDATAGNCSFTGHRWDKKSEEIDILLKQSCSEDVCPEMGIGSINSYPRNGGVFFVATTDDNPFCGIKEKHKEIIKKQLKSDKAAEKNFFTRFTDKLIGK